MKTRIQCNTKHYIITGLCGLLLGFSGIALAAEKTGKIISVQVFAPSNAPSVFGTGYQVTIDKKAKSSGSMGKYHKGKGPANATYSFGYRDTRGTSFDCGSAKLTKNSKVKLILSDKKGKYSCKNKVTKVK